MKSELAKKYKTIFIASDHAGLDLKNHLIEAFPELPFENLGTDSTASVDYPDFAEKLGLALKPRLNDSIGLLICGSGQGMAIRANRFPFIRAALCWNTEVAKLAREHNNANVLVMGGRHTAEQDAEEILKVFLSTDFAGGRHQGRIDKLNG